MPVLLQKWVTSSYHLQILRPLSPPTGFAKNLFLILDYYGSGWVPLGIFFGKSSKNSPKPVLIFWSSIARVFCLYTLLKVVGYYDFQECSVHVSDGSPKKVWMWGGWVG